MRKKANKIKTSSLSSLPSLFSFLAKKPKAANKNVKKASMLKKVKAVTIIIQRLKGVFLSSIVLEKDLDKYLTFGECFGVTVEGILFYFKILFEKLLRSL